MYKEKIESLLKSSKIDQGLNLLRDVKNEELVEFFCSLIQERVRDIYFDGISDFSIFNKGLLILKEFTPNITV